MPRSLAPISRSAAKRCPQIMTSSNSICSDCPPVGYPTDKTRCADCPITAADEPLRRQRENLIRALQAKQTRLDELMKHRTAMFWSPCRKYLITVSVLGEIEIVDDRGYQWERA